MKYCCPTPCGCLTQPKEVCYILRSGMFMPNTAGTLMMCMAHFEIANCGILQTIKGVIRQIALHQTSNTALHSIRGTL